LEDVRTVDSCCGDPYQDLGSSGMGLWALVDAKHFWPAEIGEYDSPHK
jgi:hypothetical protein